MAVRYFVKVDGILIINVIIMHRGRRHQHRERSTMVFKYVRLTSFKGVGRLTTAAAIADLSAQIRVRVDKPKTYVRPLSIKRSRHYTLSTYRIPSYYQYDGLALVDLDRPVVFILVLLTLIDVFPAKVTGEKSSGYNNNLFLH